MSTNSSNVAVVRKLIEDHHHLTVTQISKELQISMQSIIKNKLQYRKITAQWVPKLLSDEQKNVRVQICETLLARYKNEGDAFLDRIVTVAETWCHHHMPESKRASKEWRRKDEECPVKAKTQPSASKVMATILWDYKGVLHIDFLHDRKTINAAYYCDLLEKVRAAYRSKRRSFPIRDVLLLHDNARPHTAAPHPPKKGGGKQNCIGLPSNTRHTARTFPPVTSFCSDPSRRRWEGSNSTATSRLSSSCATGSKHDHLHFTTPA
jgi:hypothetical protein